MEQQKIRKKNMLTNEIKEFIQEMLKTGTIVEELIRKHTGASNQSTVNKGCHEQTLICKTLLENENFLQEIEERFTDALFKNETFQEKLNSMVNKKLEAEREIYEKEISKLNEKIEAQEQYSRRNCLLLHGIPETPNENIDSTVKQFVFEHFNYKLFDSDIDRSHRLKSRNATNIEKTQSENNEATKVPVPPIIIKLTSHNVKNDLLTMKRLLRGTGYMITESLTAIRLRCVKKLQELRYKGKITSFWTYDGTIFYTKKNEDNTETDSIYKVNNFTNFNI